MHYVLSRSCRNCGIQLKPEAAQGN